MIEEVMSIPEIGMTCETGAQVFSYDYEGVCNNKLLITFTEYLSRVYESFMTPREFKIVLFCSNELIQNIGFYSMIRDANENGNAAGIGKFSILGTAEKIIISSENAVTRDQANKITANLHYCNSLNPTELKILYKQKLREESPEDSKGGGIGLIEILRKSRNPVLYSIFEKNNSIFIKLVITVWRNENHE
jgi:hypothetical protein